MYEFSQMLFLSFDIYSELFVIVIIIIIIIIVIAKTTIFERQLSLGVPARLLRPTPSVEDQVSVFMPPIDRMSQLYPQTPNSLFVAFYDSQGYDGGILTLLHTGDPQIIAICNVEFKY
jgi:MFS superfamily sulfate permease-like transporter